MRCLLIIRLPFCLNFGEILEIFAALPRLNVYLIKNVGVNFLMFQLKDIKLLN